MKRFIRIMAVALVITVAFIAGATSAQPFPPGPGSTPAPSGATAITSGPGDKMYPAISGNTVVWLDNTTWSVQVYDVASGQSTTIPGNNTYAVVSMRQADVSGNYVIWTGMDAATGATDIYLYDTVQGSTAPLTSDPGNQMSPSISGDTACWNEIDMTTGKGKVYVYNVASGRGTPLVAENASAGSARNQVSPAIGGDTLAWFDDGGNVSGHLELTWLSLSTGSSMTFESSTIPFGLPAVSSDGRLITWVAEKNGAPLLFMADTVALDVKRVTETGAMPAYPAADGNYIVWTDYRNGNGDIYLYDIQSGQERQITSNSAEQALPDISGSRIVWMGQDTGQWEIYEMEVSGAPEPITPEPITQAPITPEPITPEPITQAPITPEPITPEPITPEPITPEPITPEPTDGLSITAADIANLQWQEDRVMPGWLTARDQARGLTFYKDPGTPDIIMIMTDRGEWYGYSSMTGLIPVNM